MSRDINLLHPALRNKIPTFLAECKTAGLEVGISETLRTREEQNALYAKGRTSPGSIVTKVQYPYSFHCWGLAFDVYRNDGSGIYNRTGNWFERVGAIGVRQGFTWGGNWKSFQDLPHFQLDTYGVTSKALVSRYQLPESFFATWGTSATEHPPIPSIPVPPVAPASPTVRGITSFPISSKSPKSDIKWLQQKLNERIFTALAIDGIWGLRTRQALQQFQSLRGLPIRDTADELTVRTLNQS